MQQKLFKQKNHLNFCLKVLYTYSVYSLSNSLDSSLCITCTALLSYGT